ncbi:hypothetical protein BN1013_01601 [Candidatus Rubidus massiliensis]|nr:hypothetical protein BN1013_01601 [Candidatus Rubidus massiliensis]
MYNIFFILLFPLCLFGWLFNDEDADLKAFENVLYQSAKFLEKKYNVSAMGSGGSIPEGIIKKFTLSFQMKGILTKEECRKLLIAMGADFLQLINNNKEVRPYLYKYPFEAKDININLFIRDEKGNYVEHPNINVADLFLGNLSYETQHYDQVKDSLKTISKEQESYEEALKIVKGNQKT